MTIQPTPRRGAELQRAIRADRATRRRVRTNRSVRGAVLALGLALLASACSYASGEPITALDTSPRVATHVASAPVSMTATAPNGTQVDLVVVRTSPSPSLGTVVILPGSDGLRPFYGELAAAYAARGYDAVVGCWFSLTQPPADGIPCPHAPVLAGVTEAAVGTVDAIVGAASAITKVAPGHLAVAGYSRGGGMAALWAARTGSRTPIVDFAGMVTGQVVTGPMAGEVDVTRSAASIVAPVLMLHGHADSIVSVDQSRALLTGLRNAGRDARLLEYSTCGTSDCNHDWIYRSDQRDDMVVRSTDWLAGHMG